MDIVKNTFLLPTLKLDDQKFEFIFLLDRSGSMANGKLNLAKRALNLFLHSLPATCYFNIITFDNQFQPMFPQSMKYDQSSLETAKLHLQGIHARGGTDILRPLEYIYGQPQIPGYLTQIFSLTDGGIILPRDIKDSNFDMATAQSDLVYRIAALQLFDGTYNLDQTFCNEIRVNLSIAKSECDRHAWNSKAFATTLALAFFLEKLKSLEDKWELVADKSKIWLIENHVNQADDMFESARKLVLGV